MAGFHHHGDLYFPNEGNAGWLEEEPKDDHPISLNDHHAEGFSDGSDSKPEVNNLPPAPPVPNPNPKSDVVRHPLHLISFQPPPSLKTLSSPLKHRQRRS